MAGGVFRLGLAMPQSAPLQWVLNLWVVLLLVLSVGRKLWFNSASCRFAFPAPKMPLLSV